MSLTLNGIRYGRMTKAHAAPDGAYRHSGTQQVFGQLNVYGCRSFVTRWVDASGFERSPYGSVWYVNYGAYFGNRDAGRSHFYGGADVPVYFRVLQPMLAVIHHLQIAWIVVASIAICMVDKFSAGKFSAKTLLHSSPVRILSLAANLHLSVWRFAVGLPMSGPTRPVAKHDTEDEFWLALRWFFAPFADDGDHSYVPQCGIQIYHSVEAGAT